MKIIDLISSDIKNDILKNEMELERFLNDNDIPIKDKLLEIRKILNQITEDNNNLNTWLSYAQGIIEKGVEQHDRD